MNKILLGSIITASILLTGCNSTDAPEAKKTQVNYIEITETNYAHAETARNFRNWAGIGANKHIAHLRKLPQRGNAAPTVQMNDDTLYSIAITETVDGKVSFVIPATDVYLGVQVVTEGGHAQHYVVGAGEYTLDVETKFAFLIYRTGMEKGFDAAHAAQDKVSGSTFNFGTYKIQNYDYAEVEKWTAKLTAETQGGFKYDFPRTSDKITDRHHWNLVNANGWGGAAAEVNVGNMYTNSTFLKGDKCLSTTFEDPESKFFTSITPYDASRYLIPDVKHVSSHTWNKNADDTVTVSFNCGDKAMNNIDTHGNDFSFTMRYYGVSQKVMDGKINPEKTVK